MSEISAETFEPAEGMVRVECEPWMPMSLTAYHYEGYLHVDMMDAGERIRWADLRQMDGKKDWERYGDSDLFVEVPHAYLDGVHDDLLGRSNYERIAEDFDLDFGGHLFIASGTYVDQLLVRVGAEIPEDLWEAIKGLTDYPVYDEEDYSRREWEDFEEGMREATEWVVRRLDEEDSGDLTDEQIEAIAEAAGRAYIEAGSVYRRDEISESEVEEIFTNMIREAVEKSWEDYARTLTNPQPEVLLNV